MKYTSYQIRQMSWAEWNATMANELNSAGFRCRGFNEETRKWENNRDLYRADSSDPKIFILGTVDGADSSIKCNGVTKVMLRLHSGI